MIRDKITSKNKDKYQADMDKLFYELTGKPNRPKYSWFNNTPYREKRYGKNKFSK
jgi:hypothetical protein